MRIPNKIKNLNIIKKKIYVPKYIYFNLKTYENNKQKILKKIKKTFKNNIIFRSASSDEDKKKSNAGKFLSIANISPINSPLVKLSIEKVFKSYKGIKKLNSQYILIQEYINNAKKVGVIFTADPKNGAPFRTINFNNSKNTSLITSGKSNGKIVSYFRYASKIIDKKKINNIEKIILQLEKIFLDQFLDIEFIITEKKIFILQVRNLYINKLKKINFSTSLKDLEKKLSKMKNESSYLLGKERYFSTMTDWNPAEIIGLKPKMLALSMYKSLITDEIWSESRVSLGYKNLTKVPLLYSFLGTPYIDVRTDINSFLIDNIPLKTQKKLITFYLNEFRKKPYFYYDKIESDLVVNCLSLDKSKYKKILLKSNLKKNEIEKLLINYKDLTENIISKIDLNIKKYKRGEKEFENLKKTKNSTINKIFLLHNLCKNYGTLPFANLARMAFVGVEFLNSMVNLRIINEQQKNEFLESLNSISSKMNDLLRKKNKSLFFSKYGHLRPNTYEISNPSYKENYFMYFKKNNYQPKNKKKFIFSNKQISLINKYLKKEKFYNINAINLINFIKKSITEREASKLFFTKIINEIFLELKILSKRIQLNEKFLQHLNIFRLLELYKEFSHKNIILSLKKEARENQKLYFHNQNFNLPNIILNKEDIYFFEENLASPSFITDKKITSESINLKKISNNINLDNKIVCIENADPGFDFIFSHNIKGLITAFGGPNSHMSIRCNEFGIPAAIGIGEKKFQQMKDNDKIYLDCKNRIISLI